MEQLTQKINKSTDSIIMRLKLDTNKMFETHIGHKVNAQVSLSEHPPALQSFFVRKNMRTACMSHASHDLWILQRKTYSGLHTFYKKKF